MATPYCTRRGPGTKVNWSPWSGGTCSGGQIVDSGSNARPIRNNTTIMVMSPNIVAKLSFIVSPNTSGSSWIRSANRRINPRGHFVVARVNTAFTPIAISSNSAALGGSDANATNSSFVIVSPP
jgi:hypothetical protein